jgi:hypothetical protein
MDKVKRRTRRRLDRAPRKSADGRVLRGGDVQYEFSGKAKGVAHGGVGLFSRLIRDVGLADAVDRRLSLFKFHLPYRESDHVISLALNAVCGGSCLDDIELRRNDEVFLDAIGADRIPDPTTAGDFLRRFQEHHVLDLMEAVDESRLKVWSRQPESFFEEAVLDADGTMVETLGECKRGMNINYKGQWGYHPLLVSLANTGEAIRIFNRPGNRPSHECADALLDDAVSLVRRAGFRKVLLRGDTDFTQTHKLDEWDAAGCVRFVFGVDASKHMVARAEDLPESAWKPLRRSAKSKTAAEPRAKPKNVKEAIVVEREYQNIRLVSEEVASFEHRPCKCRKAYRVTAVRKNLSVEKGEAVLFDQIRYFFYITNDGGMTDEQVVATANDRCDQENVIAQLKGGVHALRAPVNTENANWAYMVCVALAWNLKAWWALMLPEGSGRWAERHASEKRKVLRMEFRTFLQTFVRIPCQIVLTGRRIVYRILSWNPWLHVFARLSTVLRC